MLYFLIISTSFLFIFSHEQCSAPATVDRQVVLEVHNKMRSRIALGHYTAKGKHLPPASNMVKMTYDCGLEASAQRAADLCIYKHTNAIPTGTGENIMFMSNTRGMTLTGLEREAMRMWEVEFDEFGFPRNFFDKDLLLTGTAHAYQMAWSSARRVGCGATLCKNGKMGLIFCHYKDQLFNKRPTYLEGKACLECPVGMPCNATTGLCG